MSLTKIQLSELLATYGELLTSNRREVVSMYCDCDCTLTEIAQEKGISRQSVRDAILKAETSLSELEQKLHLAKFVREVNQALQNGDDNAVVEAAKRFVGKE